MPQYDKLLSRSSARYHALKDQGLCTTCGGDESEPGHTRCRDCRYKANARTKAERVKYEAIDHPITTTGQHYRDRATGEVGRISPCPCDDPVILRFADGYLDVFWLHELEPTDNPITIAKRDGNSQREGRRQPNASAVTKSLKVHQFLMTQTRPVRRSAIQHAIGSTCHYQLESSGWSMLGANLVRKHYSSSRLCLWELTELGRADGEQIIKSLRHSESQIDI